MELTYQQKIIAAYLHSAFGHLHSWPFCSVSEVEEELRRNEIAVCADDYLVLCMDGSHTRCGTVRKLEDLAQFPADSILISYHILERALHEQHADYIEL